MAKLTVLPEQAIVSGFKGTVDFYEYMGIPVARKWPRSPGKRRSPAVEAQWQTFIDSAALWKQLDQEIRDYYNQLASGTGMTGRDMFTRGYISGLYRYPHDVEEEMKLTLLDPETQLFQQYPINAAIPWTDIDLSPYITIHSKFALVRGRIQRNSVVVCDDFKLFIRPKGGTHSVELCKWWCQKTPSFTQNNDTILEVDTDRKIQYKLDFPVGGTECEVVIWLLGYGEQ